MGRLFDPSVVMRTACRGFPCARDGDSEYARNESWWHVCRATFVEGLEGDGDSVSPQLQTAYVLGFGRQHRQELPLTLMGTE